MSMADDIARARAAAEAAAGYRRWHPKAEGDSITGKVLEVQDAEGDWGPFKVTVVEQEDGSKVSVSWVGTVLKGKFTELGVEPGKVVHLEYRGERQNAKATGSYQDWAVACIDSTEA